VKLLIDTNRLSDALAQVDDVVDRLEVAVIVLGEIRSGFLRGKRSAENETRLSWFLAQDGVSTLAVDASVSHRYASLHQLLRAAGRPIPTNDLWIASLAIEHGLVLYTRDAHFADLPGLACI